MKRMTWRLASALALSCALSTCAEDEAPLSARIVSPVFGEGCRFAQCGERGACAEDREGAPVCLCDVGYAGERCDGCERGFHLDALERCVPDKACAEQETDPCGTNGRCDDSQRVIACECDEGYEGPRCNLCRTGFEVNAHDECLQLVLVPGDATKPSEPVMPPPEPPAPPPVVPMPRTCVAADCSSHGRCDASSGAIVCACDDDYAGTRCERCADEFRRDASDACVPAQQCDAGFATPLCDRCATGYHREGEQCVRDEQCAETSCSRAGTCDTSTGTIRCACDDGYFGERCQSCAPGLYFRDLATGTCHEIGCADRPSPPVSFEGLINFPPSQDTCQTGVPFNTVALTMTSRAGHGPLWACGPSRAYELTTKHVLLEVANGQPAQLIFGAPIVELRFDYAAPNELSLEVRADGMVMTQALTAARRALGQARYAFAVPIEVVELHNLGSGTLLVALDNLDYEYATCQ